MQYHIPTSEEVVIAIYRALKKYGTIDSQWKLREKVTDELKNLDRSYRVGLQRVRKLAVKAGFINIEIRTREGDNEVNICPVCDGKLKRIKNMSLWGKAVITGYKCTSCPYKSGKKRQIPTRYIFHLK